jgi:ankyrin repeat protein
MVRNIVVLACLLTTAFGWASGVEEPALHFYEYDVARTHELKPHRRTIPCNGVSRGSQQLRLTLTVTAAGDVVEARASGDAEALKFWPKLEGEVRQWKFLPFEENGRAVTARVEEYVDLVPPESLPARHVAPPALRPDSEVLITLQRSGCYGSCRGYQVTLGTENGIVFEGRNFVVAQGQHRGKADAAEVRKLAAKFIAADFYSMDNSYHATVTDNPTYDLSIVIDDQGKEVSDYVGSWVGMPAVITELEDEVDAFARTRRWIEGEDGLVQTLQAEKFDFHSYAGQLILKEAAARGQTATVRGLLQAGVPLHPLPPPQTGPLHALARPQSVGWLYAASQHPETLQLLLEARASKTDQNDKNLALARAARAGNVESVRALIVYGANPKADLRKSTVMEGGRSGMVSQGPGAGSILIYAAQSGNPEMVREILRYRPKLEARDPEGKTAIFAAADDSGRASEEMRAECVRLLAQAGADVNARDREGNTPLHETYLTAVEKELLKLGANVNARNHDGETPIFTTVDDEAIPLFVAYGADLSIRNKKGETALEAAKHDVAGPRREEVLRKAMESVKRQ